MREIPFSRRGSWLDISPVVALHTVRDDLHLVTHQTGMHAVLRLTAERDGARLPLEFEASPSVLTWTEGGRPVVRAVFEGLDTVRLTGSGAELRIADAAEVLTPFTGTYLFTDPIDGSAVFTSYESGRRYRITAVRGELSIEGSEALGESVRAVVVTGDEVGGWEVAIEEFETARHPYRSSDDFDALVAAAADEFAAFADTIAGWRDASTPAAELAAYVLWSATVSPRGFLRRESVLMSKHWMDKVWSWDHCFNALALSPGDPGFALDQFLTPFDHQDAAGAMPDSVTHSEILYNFVKPPIHGWALAKLREQAELDRATLVDIQQRLAAWTDFWLDYRRVPGHPLPHYQHGNDSGWDNSTTFDRDRVIESPDLAAFLVVQLDVLIALTEELGLEGGVGLAQAARRGRRCPARRVVERRSLRRPLGGRRPGEHHRQPAQPAAHCRRSQPACRGDRAPRCGDRTAPDGLRTGDPAGRLARVRGRRLLARADLGALDDPDRRRAAGQRVPGARR